MPKPKTRSILIESAVLTAHDRYIVAYWLGMSVPRTGDVQLKLTRPQQVGLEDLLEMLGKKTAPSN